MARPGIPFGKLNGISQLLHFTAMLLRFFNMKPKIKCNLNLKDPFGYYEKLSFYFSYFFNCFLCATRRKGSFKNIHSIIHALA